MTCLEYVHLSPVSSTTSCGPSSFTPPIYAYLTSNTFRKFSGIRVRAGQR